MVEEEEESLENEGSKESVKEIYEPRTAGQPCNFLTAPFRWLRRISVQTHWSFVFGVVSIYGFNQGLGGALARVATEYYMKDVQKVQPSESQALTAIINIPWIVKPLWGILTDVLPMYGYRRRPYFVLAGFLGAISMLFISLHSRLHIFFALLLLTAGSAAAAIADVTIDACIAHNSKKHPSLAPDMQSLAALSSSIGALLGFSISGIFVHLLGPKGVFGLLAITSVLVSVVGFVLNESRVPAFSLRQVNRKFVDAGKSMWTTLKYPDVWRPCLYMYMSFGLSLNIHEGLFYWFTDSKDGPLFSQETVGFILSISSIGGLLGAALYQLALKDHPFRSLLLWSQLLFAISGMLDLVLVLRLNLEIGLPDYVFVVIDHSISHLIGRLKWMPLLVLSSKLCPPGIEGTFFALLMSIDNAGFMTSSWAGGLLLHVLNVTRTRFDNLWLAILIRNVLRLFPLCLLFLVPGGDPKSSLLPSDILGETDEVSEISGTRNLELVSLVHSVDHR